MFSFYQFFFDDNVISANHFLLARVIHLSNLFLSNNLHRFASLAAKPNSSMCKTGVTTVDNYIGGNFVAPSSGNYMDVVDPAVPGKILARCALSSAKDVDIAVEVAQKALPAWSKMTIKARAAIMMKFHSIIQREAEDLANMIVLENGKNFTEAMAEGKNMLFGMVTAWKFWYHQ